ncbi:hypothetical protein [Haliovirga abyssi]|uniref:DUF4381 domain-containing protein n=1 Tax=Haliovirga abyssi TaxID=2996794 RepID=A0AAU9D2V0_9FUSO|nr:hypothetical protein [Haliovirga abyssi]BDU50329.1 hypothetical protein HLVA_08980 [Haliovirga abyssi]
MKKIISLIILLVVFSQSVFSSEKPIYIGDLIRLKISGDTSEKEIKNSFKDFEIEKIENIDGNYIIEFRSFNTGINKIKIGNKIIKIDVKTSLNKFKNKDVIENSLDNQNIKKPIPVTILLYISVLFLIILIIAYIVYRIIKRKKDKKMSPKEYFELILKNKSSKNSLEVWSFALKKYLEKKFNVNIFDKTQKETELELGKYDFFQNIREDILKWLEVAYNYKYQNISSDETEKEIMLNELKDIIDKLEKINIIQNGGKNV